MWAWFLEFYRLRKLNWVAYCQQVIYRDRNCFSPFPQRFCHLFPNLSPFRTTTQAIFVRVLRQKDSLLARVSKRSYYVILNQVLSCLSPRLLVASGLVYTVLSLSQRAKMAYTTKL